MSDNPYEPPVVAELVRSPVADKTKRRVPWFDISIAALCAVLYFVMVYASPISLEPSYSIARTVAVLGSYSILRAIFAR